MVFIQSFLKAIALSTASLMVYLGLSCLPGAELGYASAPALFKTPGAPESAPPEISGIVAGAISDSRSDAISGSAVAYLPPGNAITSGPALLRYSLPIDNKEIRKVQADIEDVAEWLRSKRWRPIKRDITKAERVLSRSRDKILADVPAARKASVETLLDQLQLGLQPLRDAADARDKNQIWLQRRSLLDLITVIEESMVDGFPFDIPDIYSDLPQLKGRASIEFETSKGSFVAVIDGYNAPVTGGNFVDLVQRGFYDGMDFIRAEDNYVLQTGDPAGPEVGFINPETETYRAVPLEIRVEGEEQPVYGDTLESLGRYLEKPILPFQAFGTLGMARPESDVNGGSSQFFFFLFEPELTPAGLNLLDGRYAAFGYVVDNKDVLDELGQGDKIIIARILKGEENLVLPS